MSHINYKYILISDLNTQQTSIFHFCSDVIFKIKNITVLFGGWDSKGLELGLHTCQAGAVTT
jgi:hypothetical protein